MALVAYSDSEGSDTEAPVAESTPSVHSAKAAAPFQKTEARKIKVDLPTLKAEPGQKREDDQEQPPAKRARTAGAFGGFNSLLPAPKRAAAQPTGLKKGVSLKTSSEAAFSRAVPAVASGDVEAVTKEEVYDEFGNTSQPHEAKDASKFETEVKIVGKSTRFKPLSVANKKKKVVKKAPAAVEAHVEKKVAEPMSEPTAVQQVTTAPKAKKSLFSVQQDEDTLPEVEEDYETLDGPNAEPNVQPSFARSTAPTPAPNSLDAIASDMNLTPAQRRQLFGRHAKDMPAKIAHFDMDAEYAANEVIRQSGETIEHRAVKAIAPGKHSLQQLVNNARTNEEGMEDKWAEGRRNRGDAGSKYGFGNFKGEQKSEDFIKINPMATIPAAVDGDLTITESNAILQYAADHSDHVEKAYPKDTKKRAEINTWLLWEASAWFSTCYTHVVQYVVQPIMGGEPNEDIIKAEAPQWNKLAGILNDQLSKTKYITGDDVTIADIAIASPMHMWEASRLPIDKYPNLQRWYGDIEKLPSWQKTQGAVQKSILDLLPKNQANGGGQQSKQNDTTENSVRATLNYTKAFDDQLTEIYFYEDAEGQYKNVNEPGNDAQEVNITDGWHRAKEFSYDKHGFSLHDFSSSSNGAWEDESRVKNHLYPEIVSFLKHTTGAKEVLVFDHTIRTKKNANKAITQESNTTQRAPVRLVHCDYTNDSAPLRVKQLLGDRADDLLSRRVAFFNVWKPLAKVEEMPLAMCDVTTSPPEDYFKLFLRYRERTGENYVMRQTTPNSHKWWYFPGMNSNQVILLKTFDSEQDGRARFVGHSAFEDPTSNPDAPERESIEIRTIVFF
ncbi:hypothetical protein LTR56_014532 [Elasticomyces elasticus]|nr:hypothetical protein LTR56_014532 [Elasticomyces elasticus]KAK3667731.1 hypothetical protein LTR22_001546 [Elasticomyces elasticus]KAK4920776.1 hypothetical protein LTR49_011679 [Elasticomyces elasticus]KAK5767116.1 hypothetical protein LTS12_002574 [Elasticomyces elasticus]